MIQQKVPLLYLKIAELMKQNEQKELKIRHIDGPVCSSFRISREEFPLILREMQKYNLIQKVNRVKIRINL